MQDSHSMGVRAPPNGTSLLCQGDRQTPLCLSSWSGHGGERNHYASIDHRSTIFPTLQSSEGTWYFCGRRSRRTNTITASRRMQILCQLLQRKYREHQQPLTLSLRRFEQSQSQQQLLVHCSRFWSRRWKPIALLALSGEFHLQRARRKRRGRLLWKERDEQQRTNKSFAKCLEHYARIGGLFPRAIPSASRERTPRPIDLSQWSVSKKYLGLLFSDEQPPSQQRLLGRAQALRSWTRIFCRWCRWRHFRWHPSAQ